MLSKLIIKLERKDGLNQNIGSILQGVLMEKIEPNYAEILHNTEINPYSQSIWISDSYMEWIICTMTEEARRGIIVPLLMDTNNEIKLERKNLSLKILNKEIQDLSYEELMDKTYFANCSPYLQISFDAPTAFKVSGRYQNYPTVTHVFQSLIRKYDAVSGQGAILSEDLLKQIEEHTSIRNYNLYSTLFHLEGVKIPAFKGKITLKLNGPQMFINLMHMLTTFGEFSGVGIKTSIGMGKMRIIEKERT